MALWLDPDSIKGFFFFCFLPCHRLDEKKRTAKWCVFIQADPAAVAPLLLQWPSLQPTPPPTHRVISHATPGKKKKDPTGLRALEPWNTSSATTSFRLLIRMNMFAHVVARRRIIQRFSHSLGILIMPSRSSSRA